MSREINAGTCCKGQVPVHGAALAGLVMGNGSGPCVWVRIQSGKGIKVPDEFVRGPSVSIYSLRATVIAAIFRARYG